MQEFRHAQYWEILDLQFVGYKVIELTRHQVD
jgi:hypothetical protein